MLHTGGWRQSRQKAGQTDQGHPTHRDVDGNRCRTAVVDEHERAFGGPAHLLRIQGVQNARAVNNGLSWTCTYKLRHVGLGYDGFSTQVL